MTTRVSLKRAFLGSGFTPSGFFSTNHAYVLIGYQCGSRWADAYDEATGQWSGWIKLDCA
jgi:hypothetical protein